MDVFGRMTGLEAASLYVGLLIVVMLGLKVFVGLQRAKLRVEPGDLTNPNFNQAARVQLNAVEDVPILGLGLLAMGLLALPVWYVHATGGALVLFRVSHAIGLAAPGARSPLRGLGAVGTTLVYLAVAGGVLAGALTHAG